MRCSVSWFILVLAVVLLLVTNCNQQLIINVRNQGGEVLQETISANVSDDIVSLEFQRSDGTLVTQLIDFRNEVQILRSLILGEEERGQSQYQVLCFIVHVTKDAFISSDAMAKLRQKNPGTVRTPEEDRGRENFTLEYRVDVSRAALISPFISELCTEAAESSYTRQQDVQQWAALQGVPESNFIAALKPFPLSTLPAVSGQHLTNDIVDSSDSNNWNHSCADTKNIWLPCQCHLDLCIGWYPCGLKYCKGKADGGSTPAAASLSIAKNAAIVYRCGIKTCRKCHLFAYYVEQKQLCLWDE